MSAPDSRKSFLSKLALGLVAVCAAPSLLWRRRATEATVAAGAIALKPEPRAIARDAASL